VARYFGKQHFNLLRDIETLISQDTAITFNFEAIEIETKVGFGIRRDRAYNMTRDGFTLLAMGFTGAKALQFKFRYIAQFNAMEAELKAQAQAQAEETPQGDARGRAYRVQTPAIPTSFVEALRLAADEAERRIEVEARAEAAEAVLTKAKPRLEIAKRRRLCRICHQPGRRP
jgi:Rha family phage regulatory protein